MISSNLFGGSRNELGPYRATRLWNDLVRTFRAGMPVGRKRRQLKVYEDAFVASDAVTWLHEYLQQNLDSGPEITRPQTVLLLQKFQRSAVIQDVRGEKSNAEPLEDNGRLFRFTRLSPRKLGATRVPLASRTNLSMPSTEYQSLCDKRTLCSSAATLDSGAADPSQRSGASFAAAQGQSSLAGARRWLSEDTVCTRTRSGLQSSQQLQQQPSSSRSAPPCSVQPAEKGTRQAQQQVLPGVRDVGILGSGQSDGTWKAVTLEHLRKALLLRSSDELPLDLNLIKGADIVQNVTQQLRNAGSGVPVSQDDDSTSPANDSFPGWLTIAMRCLARWPKSRASCGKRGSRSGSSGSSNDCHDMPRYPGFERDVYAMVKEYFESQPEPVIPFRFYRVLAFAWDALSEMMHNRLLRALQLCLLLLPPKNRRHLQILLRLLHGLSNNSGLLVDVADKAFCMDTVQATAVGCPSSQSARDIIIRSFWRSILRSHIECDVDELATMRIVSFFIDHHEQVMNVPADLTKSIECSLSSVHKNELSSATTRPKSMLQQPAFGPVVRSISLQQLPLQESQKQLQQQLLPGEEPQLQVAKLRPVSYCLQVTKEEYEEQRMSVSERALTELLENILADSKMTEKEKKKKLKQFQKAYPEIFLARFPTPESQPSCMKEQPKIKQPLLARPLRLLRSLR